MSAIGAQLPRLLRGVGERPMHELDQHVAVHGPLSDVRLSPEQIVSSVQASGLRGHGGAAFPTAIKMRSVASRRGSKILLLNAAEGEPASKDRALLREVPHLVLDGATLAARAVGAKHAILAVSESDARGRHALAAALRERRERALSRAEPEWELVSTPERYVVGQESALVNLINDGPGLPTFGPRPSQRGARGRPTLVQNAETVAHLALIARHGPDWFRGLGTSAHPGSTLISVSGAVSAPGVYEIAHGMELSELMRWVGGGESSALLIGGYFGTWISASAVAAVHLSGEGLAQHGASLGAGVIVAVPPGACAVAETARVADWFSDQSAGQCGACVNGLGAIAYTVAQVAVGAASRADLANLERWCTELPGRGACQHPDGASRFIGSALALFAAEFADHARHGRCERCAHPAVLPVPVTKRLAAAA
jgi:NADH:ubiquinone oxidoreductase subunit F (NADH-binding)